MHSVRRGRDAAGGRNRDNRLLCEARPGLAERGGHRDLVERQPSDAARGLVAGSGPRGRARERPAAARLALISTEVEPCMNRTAPRVVLAGRCDSCRNSATRGEVSCHDFAICPEFLTFRAKWTGG